MNTTSGKKQAKKPKPTLSKHELKEIYRKSFHLSSLIVPFSYRYLLNYDKSLAIAILLPLALIAVIFELLRLEHKTVKRIFYRLFGIMLRKHEMADLTGASYLLTSSVFTITLFPKEIAFIALSFLALGDTFAAIFGIRYGKRKFKGSYKSLEGSLACFVSCFTYALLFNIHPGMALIGALTATFAELSKIPVDDNIKLPIVTAIVMSIASIVIPVKL